MNKKHKCAVTHCQIFIPNEMLMCVGHWRELPTHLRKHIRDNCPEGGTVHPNPTGAWEAAVDAAKKYFTRR